MRRLILFVILIVVPASAVKADVQDGIVALGRGDYNTALSEFRPLAEQGNALAQNQLGLMYEKGLVYPGYGFITHEPDYEQAVSWYRRAAREGLATAQYNLGRMYAEGHGVAHDYGEAAWWYLKAAVQGLPAAQYNLAIRYDEGSGVRRDDVLAHVWASLAAAGSADAIQGSATQFRDEVAARMTPEAVSEAKSLAREWKRGTDPERSKESPHRAREARDPVATASAETDIEDRLRTLKALYDKGLITDTEYADKRKDILQDL